MGFINNVKKFLILLLVSIPIFTVYAGFDIVGALGPILIREKILTLETLSFLYGITCRSFLVSSFQYKISHTYFT